MPQRNVKILLVSDTLDLVANVTPCVSKRTPVQAAQNEIDFLLEPIAINRWYYFKIISEGKFLSEKDSKSLWKLLVADCGSKANR